MDKLTKPPVKKSKTTESRVIAFAAAGLVCFVIAFALGAGSWYLLGTNRRISQERNSSVIQTPNQNSANQNSINVNLNPTANSAAPTATPTIAPTADEIKKAPAGELAVGGGVVELGGDDTDLPAARVSVAPFAIAETEVTNDQYAEFVTETDHQAPSGWKNKKFPDGAADVPVVGVSWQDVNEYCRWLSKKLGAAVRLPSEAEWELAAHGDKNFKYPWGNEWNDEALESAKKNRKVLPVKSFPAGRSPVGAYDMVGNVWEWTSDLAVDENNKPILYEKNKQRIIKGGSAFDERKYLAIKPHLPRPEDKPSAFLGFRYVIIRK